MRKLIYNRVLWVSILIFLLVFNIDKSISGVKKALNICASAIVPSLFVFMIISDVLVTLIVKENNLKGSPKLLAYILGSFCGFPVGAYICKIFCDNKIISYKDAIKIIPFCNNASFGFVIGAIGISFLGDQKLGYILYISQLSASLIPLCFIKIEYKYSNNSEEQFSLFEVFLNSIEKTTINVLKICGLICIFSAILEILKSYSFYFLSIFLELSNGIAYCCTFKEQHPYLSFALCGFCCGFSGLCVILQIKSAFNKCELSFKRLFLCKALQGILTAIFSIMGYNFFVCT